MTRDPGHDFTRRWPRSIAGWKQAAPTPEGGLRVDLTDSRGYTVPLTVHLIPGGAHIVLGDPGNRPYRLLTNPPPHVACRLQVGDDGMELAGDGLALRIGRDPFLSLWTDQGAERRPVWSTGPLTDAPGGDADDTLYRGTGYAVDGPAWFHVPLTPDDACYGLGERFGSFNHRGRTVTLWADDAFGLPAAQSYIGVPFLMSTRGWALLLPTAAPTRWDVGHTHGDDLEVTVAESWLEFYVVAADPAGALAFLQEVSGPARPVPPWSFGVWMSRWGYRSQDELLEVARTLRARELPVDVIHLDPYWLTEKNGHTCVFEWDRQAFPDPDAMYRELARHHVRLSLWINPFLARGSAVYEDARRQGYLVAHPDGTPARLPRFDDDNGVVDFTNPEAAAWFGQLVRRELERGAAVVKTDFGESAPSLRVRYRNGVDGPVGRNLNGLLYQAASYEAARAVHGQDGMVWGRSGYLGSQRYPLQWGGDSGCSYAYMAASLRGALSYLMSGAAFTAFDAGGFAGTPTPDLYCRWAAMAFLFSHVRFHGTTPREPWAFGEDAVDIWRTFANLRYQLLPYLWQQADASLAQGLPLVRPLVLMHPDDPAVRSLDDQYYLGADLLVAPLFNAAGHRTVYLPEGRWYDWFSPGGAGIGGRQWIRLTDVPLDRLGLYVRAGAIIPLYPSGLQWVPEDRPPAERFRVVPAAGPLRGTCDGLHYQYTDGLWRFEADRPVIVECWNRDPIPVIPGAPVTVSQP
jgi:alpha-D-xyloside xylohydrolase